MRKKLLLPGFALIMLLLASTAYADPRTGVFPVNSEQCVAVNDSSLQKQGNSWSSSGVCIPSWTCRPVGPCQSDGVQMLECIDTWDCGTLEGIPQLHVECDYEPGIEDSAHVGEIYFLAGNETLQVSPGQGESVFLLQNNTPVNESEGHESSDTTIIAVLSLIATAGLGVYLLSNGKKMFTA